MNDNRYFFGIDLYDADEIWLSGVWRQSSLPVYVNFFNLLYSPDAYYFSEKMTVERPFAETEINLRLPSNVVKRLEEPDPNFERYREAKNQAFQREDGKFDPCWRRPLESKVNSPFGKPRTLPNGRRYYHSGVDLKAPTGVPLPAMQDGEVIFADKTVVPGNTVLLYHGSGLTSQFMHMSRIDVQEGQTVSKGDLVGLSGATGRVEGPHLHWELHWKGLKLNPLKFVEIAERHCRMLAQLEEE